MAVPRHKHTKSSVHQRRMHIFIKPAVLASCPKCTKPVLPHTVCKYCGFYRGREMVNVLGKLTKKEKKSREQEIQKVKKGKKESPLTMEELSKK